jgi:hypothetical protein
MPNPNDPQRPPFVIINVDELAKLGDVVEAAKNVVASWRGNISRQPHIGRLRDALAALEPK